MPEYSVKIKIDGEYKIIKVIQPTLSEAEVEVYRQTPGCKILTIDRKSDS